MLNRSAIILSDLHLGPTCPPDTSKAAALVIRRHPGCETMLLGDTFDLSIDPPKLNPAVSVARHLADNSELSGALREQLQRGVPVTIFAGNHDAQLAAPEVRARLLNTLGLAESAPLSCGVWCVRRTGLHLEHGHIYDPDNAQTHPLVAPSYDTEPLGVTMMRRVLAPTQALFFAHAHELTPMTGLTQAFIRQGLSAPRLVARYYIEAFKLFARASPASFCAEALLGESRLIEYAQGRNLDIDLLNQLLSLRAVPRHHLKKEVFFRLYLDRSIATAVWLSACVLGALTSNPAFWGVSGASLVFLAASLARGKNRYRGSLESRLHDAAMNLRAITGARAVVFGHTHIEEARPGYVNSGSFAFGSSNGRSYLLYGPAESLLRVNVNGSHGPQMLDVFLPGEAVNRSDPEAAA